MSRGVCRDMAMYALLLAAKLEDRWGCSACAAHVDGPDGRVVLLFVGERGGWRRSPRAGTRGAAAAPSRCHRRLRWLGGTCRIR